MNLLALSLFQHALLVTFVLLFLGSVWAMVKGWAGRREGLIWAAVWLAAGVAVLPLSDLLTWADRIAAGQPHPATGY